MRSRPINDAPAASVIASIRPSVDMGTPEMRFFGAGPSLAGQLRRTRSKLAPMPPEETITASAVASNRPSALREESAPRSTLLGASTVPLTPVTAPPSIVSSSTWWRKAKRTRPAFSCSRQRRTNGSSSPGPVPHVM